MNLNVFFDGFLQLVAHQGWFHHQYHSNHLSEMNKIKIHVYHWDETYQIRIEKWKHTSIIPFSSKSFWDWLMSFSDFLPIWNENRSKKAVYFTSLVKTSVNISWLYRLRLFEAWCIVFSEKMLLEIELITIKEVFIAKWTLIGRPLMSLQVMRMNHWMCNWFTAQFAWQSLDPKNNIIISYFIVKT